jgi:hypothetical protein
MRTPERVDLMKKYFTIYGAEYPSFSNIIRISLGLVLAGTFIMYTFKNTLLVGLILILFGLSLFAIWIRPYFRDVKLYKERPLIQHMHNWLLGDLNKKIKERAIETLRLNMKDLRAENFLIIPYPVYWAEPGVSPDVIKRRETEEGHFIYSVWKVQVVALTKNYISFYNCIYDWMNDLILSERTNEFFYDDISSVKNDVKSIEKRFVDQDEEDTENNKLTTFVFEVTNMSSDTLSVITKIPELKYSPELEVNLEKAVQALRITLRKRRYDEDQDPIIMEVEDTTKEEENEEHEEHDE